MKKNFLTYLILTFVLTSAFHPLNAKASIQAIYFVDPLNGNDVNNGTSISTAFKTIDKARQVVRTINSSMTGDIFVYLRGGTYTLSSTITFDEFDSGTNGFNIIYQAFSNETPIVSSDERVTGWTLYDAAKNIYKGTASTSFDTRQLYVNGFRAIRARSGGGLNNSSFDSLGHKTTDIGILSWKNINNLEMVYNEKWTNSRCGVSAVSLDDPDTLRITLKQPGWRYCSNRGLTSCTNPWYYENAYELLDSEGEWYLDKSGAINGTANTFYYKPYSSEDMNTATVVAPKLEKLITIQGSKFSSLVHNIQFVGLNCQFTTWVRPNGTSGHSDVQNNALLQTVANTYTVDGAAITLKNANNILFERCAFSKLGCVGINVFTGCKNNLVQGCTFSDISGNGLQFGDYNGWSTSTSPNYILTNNDTAILRNNDVRNCFFDKCGVEYRSSTAIGAVFPQNMDIVNNEIGNMPYGGTHLGWGWTNYSTSNMKNNTVKHNYYHNVLAELDDCAGMYFLGPNGSSSEVSPVDSNFVRTSHDHALYFDNGSSWYTGNNNVFDDIVSVNINISSADKHDIHISNTYADDNTYWNNGTNCTVNPINVVSNGNWPLTAKNVIADAGLTNNYKDIRGSYYVNEHFNNTILGAAPDNWVPNRSGGTVSAVDVLINGDKSIKLTKTITSNNLNITKNFLPVSGYVYVRYKVKTDETTSWKNAAYLYDRSGVPVTCMIFNAGNIQLYKGPGLYTTIQSFTANTWYDIKIALNTASKKLDVYINDTLKLTQDTFRNRVSDIASVQFAIGSGNTGTFYYDNVKVFADQNFVNESFDSTKMGTIPYGWKANNAGVVGVDTISGIKCVKVYKSNSSGYLNATKTVAPMSGKVFVCAKIRTEATTDWKGMPTVMDRTGTVAASVIFKDGNIQLYYGSGSYTMIQPFTAGNWYRIMLVMNTETNKLDVYVDSVLKVSQANFRNPVKDISQVQFGIGATFTGTLYYDDVQIFIDNVTVVNTSVNSERNQLNITPENFVQNKFVAYPNPFTNNITILHSVAGANDIVNIYSLQGALIGSQKIVPNSSQSYFNTSKLAKGQYVIKYIGAVQQQTILVNKF